MPTLFVKCEKCSEEVATPIAVAAPEFKGMLLISGLSHRCAKCGSTGTYFTPDYFVHASSESPADASAAGSQGRYRRSGGVDTAMNSMSGAPPPP